MYLLEGETGLGNRQILTRTWLEVNVDRAPWIKIRLHVCRIPHSDTWLAESHQSMITLIVFEMIHLWFGTKGMIISYLHILIFLFMIKNNKSSFFQTVSMRDAFLCYSRKKIAVIREMSIKIRINYDEFLLEKNHAKRSAERSHMIAF